MFKKYSPFQSRSVSKTISASHLGIAVFLMIAVLTFSFYRIHNAEALIADGANAIDALGQYDDSLSAPGPIYTKGAANNAPNKLGLSFPQGIALDSANHRLFVADAGNNRILVYTLNTDN